MNLFTWSWRFKVFIQSKIQFLKETRNCKYHPLRLNNWLLGGRDRYLAWWSYLVTLKSSLICLQKSVTNVTPRGKYNVLAYQAVQTVHPRCPLALNIQWKDTAFIFGKSTPCHKGHLFLKVKINKRMCWGTKTISLWLVSPLKNNNSSSIEI